jgi:hypothetical protein
VADELSQDDQQLRERYQELLQEFRIVLPGVQIFFAFRLTAPFSAAFADLDHVGRTGYAASVSAAALAVIVLAAPAAYHHVGPRQARESRVRDTVRLKVAGLILSGVAASAGLFVVMRLVFGPPWGTTALLLSVLAWSGLWFAFPVIRDQR